MRAVARPRVALLVLLVTLLAGCTGPDPSGSPAATAAPNAAGGEVRFSCGGGTFDAEVLSTPGHAENSTEGAGPFLGNVVASGELPDGTIVPATGWHRISQDNMSAEFMNLGVEPPAFLEFRRIAGEGWELDSWGSCRPQVVVPNGGRAATWVLDPGRLGPGPESSSFFALVSEPLCTSGQRSDLRLIGPVVQALEDRVYVLFATQPLGGEGECPGDPPVSVTVQLGEPLGDRELVDPSSSLGADGGSVGR
jgi:hypothetical protein